MSYAGGDVYEEVQIDPNQYVPSALDMLAADIPPDYPVTFLLSYAKKRTQYSSITSRRASNVLLYWFDDWA